MPKDNGAELFYLVDDQDKVLGSVKRAEAHASSSIKHRSVFILLFNKQGELLLQKRSQAKDSFPGYWTVSASGHVTYGQSYDEAAQREVKEEIGLDLAITDLKPLAKIYITIEHEFAFVYFANYVADIQIDFDRDEIDEVKWVSLNKLAEFMSKNQMTPAAKMVIKMII